MARTTFWHVVVTQKKLIFFLVGQSEIDRIIFIQDRVCVITPDVSTKVDRTR